MREKIPASQKAAPLPPHRDFLPVPPLPGVQTSRPPRAFSINIVSKRRSAFTLIEMLVVVSISTILLTLAANVAQDVVVANQITSAGETVMDEFRLARHTAIARDRVVEVRLYRPTASNTFGEAQGINSLQTFIFDEDNNRATPVREARRLPEAIQISENTTLSSLITDARMKNDWKEGDEQIPLADAGTDYTAYRVRFLPDGSTDLDTQEQWFLTLYPRSVRESPPPNYVTVQIKPARGNIRLYRP